jgi:alkyl sulfatase BDS1-like metallo-beta-lactamase superfamily hydrolase
MSFAKSDASGSKATSYEHFDAKGKLPSSFTIALQNGLRQSLPFEDERDFAEAQKGFIAAPPYKQIMAEADNVAWDMGSYEFLLQIDR